MSSIKYYLFASILGISLLSCAQEEKIAEPKKVSVSEEILIAKANNHRMPHPYGGWYCPDNFGFKPVNIQELDQVPAIHDRLPTKEEASNGTSLIYVDSSKYPDAFPLEMELPRLAKIYNPYKEMSELIIVIQAIVIGEDTILGYRFPSGGNGSAWIGQVSFLSKNAVDEMGHQPMIYKKSTLKGKREDVWSYFTKSKYAKDLGIKFNEVSFFSSEWTGDSRRQLKIDNEYVQAKGWIANHYGCIYMQLDYLIQGEQYTEKMLICDSEEEGYSDLHFAAGPFFSGMEKEEKKWSMLVEEIENQE